jgi:hypothetical protein
VTEEVRDVVGREVAGVVEVGQEPGRRFYLST